MRRAEEAIARLADGDPARSVRVPQETIEAALARVLASVAGEDEREEGVGDASEVRRRRGFGLRRARAAGVGRLHARAIVLALLAALALTAVALAASGAFRAGAPVRHSDPDIGVGGRDLGAVVRTRLLPVSTPDPYGGPPWGMRVVYTSRGVGCLEVGRLVGGRLGVLGQDGAFGNDGRFHELRPGRLSGGGSCRSLDGRGVLFDTGAWRELPASGPALPQSCMPPPTPSASYGRGSICPPDGMRQLYFGLLGPDARSLAYRTGKRVQRMGTAGHEGAYLIALPATRAFLRHDHYIGTDLVDSLLPWPWLTPVRSISYSRGRSCDVAKLRPSDIPELSPRARMRPHPCSIPGYIPPGATTVTHAQVAAPLHIAVVRGEHGYRSIEVSFVARVGVSGASGAYQLVEDTSSPSATFSATNRDIKPGERVAFRESALAPGTYSGTVTYTDRAPAPYPTYLYGRGPVVGRFRITLHGGMHLCLPQVKCTRRR